MTSYKEIRELESKVRQLNYTVERLCALIGDSLEEEAYYSTESLLPDYKVNIPSRIRMVIVSKLIEYYSDECNRILCELKNEKV